MLDGFGHFGGQGPELVVDPGFEAGQVGVLIGEEPVMDEYSPEVVGCPSRRFPVTVEAFMGQGSLPASNGRQERLDLGRAFPGDDAFRSIGLAEDVDQAVCRCRIRRIGEQQGGEVVPECAAGTDAAAVELTFVAAAGTVEVMEDAGAWGATGSSLLCGPSGEQSVLPAVGAGAVCAGRHGEAGTADLAFRPGCPGPAGVAAAAGALDGAGCAGPAADSVPRGESCRKVSGHRR